MSVKTQRSQLQELLAEVLDAAPDDETRNRQRPLTHRIFDAFKQLKEQVKVTPEELEAEMRKRREVEADLSATKSALSIQETATQDAVSKAATMRTVIRQLRSCIQMQSLRSLASALQHVDQLCVHEKLSSQYKSDADEELFRSAIHATYHEDDDTRDWFRDFTIWLHKGMEEQAFDGAPDTLEEYRNHMTTA